ncbi:coiled-coil domain-containing protein [Moorella sp. ACPs]|uniref:coiled-coil domain-containing protein n=1 Tax=Neomoorella carbonis TaxID=3062783 RepID=UPI00324E4FA6
MHKYNKRLYLILVSLFIFFSIPIVTNAATDTLTTPKLEQVYEALLETKNDKIIILNSIVNWILALAAIFVTLLTYGWSLTYKKLELNRKKLEQNIRASNDLITSLINKEAEISKAEEKINEILATADFREKMAIYEKNIELIQSKIEELEQFASRIEKMRYTRERYLQINRFLDFLRLLGSKKGPFLERMDKTDLDIFKEIVEKEKQVDDLTTEEIKLLNEKLNAIYIKYRKGDDDYSYMI